MISSLHPSNQPFINVTNDEPATRRGIWQVKPIIQGWDHVDFIGVDFLDFKRKGAELANFYTGIINDLLRVEATEGKRYTIESKLNSSSEFNMLCISCY